MVMEPAQEPITIAELARRHLLMDGGTYWCFGSLDEAVWYAQDKFKNGYAAVILFDYHNKRFEVVVPNKPWLYVVEMS